MADSSEDARRQVETRRREFELLKAEFTKQYEDLESLRNSAIFRLREMIVPEGSARQRFFKAFRSGAGLASAKDGPPGYAEWLQRYDTLTSEDYKRIRDRLAELSDAPGFSILVSGPDAGALFLETTIRSVSEQLYQNWGLLVSSETCASPDTRAVVERWQATEARLKVIDGSDNDALATATTEFFALIAPGDVLVPHALFTIAEFLGRSPDAAIIYSDEDRLDAADHRSRPHFKPDWDPLLLLCFNYVGQFSAYRTDVARKVGGFRDDFGDHRSWDFALRLTEEVRDAQIVHVPHVLYHARARSGFETKSGERVLYAALDRRNEKATVAWDEKVHGAHVYFTLPMPPPRVSVIIPTRDRVDLLSMCLESLYAKTDYPGYEVVIVDNGSAEPQTKDYLDGLRSSGKAKVLRVDAPFNFSALNNRALDSASGEVLAFLNNDIEIVDTQWMTRLAALAARPGIGAVGARLLYPGGAVQHAGVVLGLNKHAWHDRGYQGDHDFGHPGRAFFDHSISAVTGACLFVSRARFESVGCFDEDLAVTFNDIDLCLKLSEQGLRNVYAGTVVCVHHESASRGRDLAPAKRARSALESVRFRARWWHELQEDPFYSPNLGLEGSAYALAHEPRVRLPWRA